MFKVLALAALADALSAAPTGRLTIDGVGELPCTAAHGSPTDLPAVEGALWRAGPLCGGLPEEPKCPGAAPVAVAPRGGCSFGDKARNAARAGAAALIVVNHDDEPPPLDLGEQRGPIPVVGVGAGAGAGLAACATARVAVRPGWAVPEGHELPCVPAAQLQPARPLPQRPPLPGTAVLGYNLHYGRANNHVVALAHALAFAEAAGRALLLRPDPLLDPELYDFDALPWVSAAPAGAAPVQLCFRDARLDLCSEAGVATGYCDERPARTRVVPTDGDRVAAVLAEGAAPYVHVGVPFGQFPFASVAAEAAALRRVRPRPAVIAAAECVSRALGGVRACAHWRRGDFAGFCAPGDARCWQTPAALAAALPASVFVATDATPAEREELRRLHPGVRFYADVPAGACPSLAPALEEQWLCAQAPDLALLNRNSTFSRVAAAWRGGVAVEYL